MQKKKKVFFNSPPQPTLSQLLSLKNAFIWKVFWDSCNLDFGNYEFAKRKFFQIFKFEKILPPPSNLYHKPLPTITPLSLKNAFIWKFFPNSHFLDIRDYKDARKKYFKVYPFLPNPGFLMFLEIKKYSNFSKFINFNNFYS